MTAPKVKRCSRCGQVKPASAFYRRRGTRTSPLLPAMHPGRLPRGPNRRRLQDPAYIELLRAVDRTRQRRRRALRRRPPPGGDAA